MKNKFGKMVLIVVLSVPFVLSAVDTVKVNSATIQHVNKIPTRIAKISCPSGWSKVLDISGIKSKWSENSPVVTCKPRRGQVIKCPEGTFFYVKGNENSDGYNNGEIGCHTPVW
ncbi:MAG: hypothetical protein U9O24_06105 [Campylobacterota bacterium]|nr:hypothetical protein [Campylobacterota bacterium]